MIEYSFKSAGGFHQAKIATNADTTTKISKEMKENGLAQNAAHTMTEM